MLTMLDTNMCIYVMKNYPLDLREKFNALAEQLCMSSITLGHIMDKCVRNWSGLEHPAARTTYRSAVMRAAKD
jgi:tRNA(fMet)-specific endonuclease VapC